MAESESVTYASVARPTDAWILHASLWICATFAFGAFALLAFALGDIELLQRPSDIEWSLLAPRARFALWIFDYSDIWWAGVAGGANVFAAIGAWSALRGYSSYRYWLYAFVTLALLLALMQIASYGVLIAESPLQTRPSREPLETLVVQLDFDNVRAVVLSNLPLIVVFAAMARGAFGHAVRSEPKEKRGQVEVRKGSGYM